VAAEAVAPFWILYIVELIFLNINEILPAGRKAIINQSIKKNSSSK